MKRILTTLIILFSIILNAQDTKDNQVSTYYFIRHAEKDRADSSNKDPHLNEKGLQRAEKWSKAFSQVEFDAIYSTDYNRTRETALPTAKNNSLELTLYNPRELNTDAFVKETKGKTVLIVGHSNSTPIFVNAILGNEKYEMIADNNNANLYIVTITDSNTSSQLLVIE